jgi:GT2 family glycosyltransferase
MKALSVVVTTYEGRELLADCLGALREQTRVPDEVLVVDDASPGDDAAWVRERFPSVRTLRLPENRGHAGAAGAGVAATSGELVAVLNNDVVAERHWCARATEAFVDADVGSVATLLVRFEDPGIIDSAGDEYMVVGVAFKRGEGAPAERYGRAGEVFSACAGAAVYRRAAFLECGGFDARLGGYYDDVDLGFRLRLGGWRCVYEPAAMARHRVGVTYGRWPRRRLYLDGRNSEWVYWANMPSGLLLRHAPERGAFFVLQCIRRALGGGLWPFLSGKAGAVLGLPTALSMRRRAQGLGGASRARVQGALLRPWLRHSVGELRRRGVTA